MKLLQKAKIGDLEISNRMAMAPMTRSRADAEHNHADRATMYVGGEKGYANYSTLNN